MIPVEAFCALVVADAGLIVYAFIDLRNRVYGNIIALVIAAMLSFLLGILITGGGVGESVAVINQTAVNGSTTYTYAIQNIPFQNTAIGYFFAFVGVLAAIMVAILSVEALREREEFQVFEKGRQEGRFDNWDEFREGHH